MKPQLYDGDIDEYLAQFKILTEINQKIFEFSSTFCVGPRTLRLSRASYHF